jgi:hypothetical protein
MLIRMPDPAIKYVVAAATTLPEALEPYLFEAYFKAAYLAYHQYAFSLKITTWIATGLESRTAGAQQR